MATLNKRRLSRGHALLTIEEDEDFVDENVNNIDTNKVGIAKRRKSSIGGSNNGNNKRRTGSSTSFGGISSKNKSPASKNNQNGQEQERLADMYKTIIKMSSENKINAKNSWNLDLIDHMGALIKNDETSSNDKNHRGVNFQKASCTLDASVKIYSSRVDDTWSSSFRILENLSRNGTNYSDDEDDDNDASNGNKRKKDAKVGSRNTSKRLGLTETIERNPVALNAVKLDNDHAVDPLFHKMSLAFDEGGAKGMLMANLRVDSEASIITFSDDVLRADLKSSIKVENDNIDNIQPQSSEFFGNGIEAAKNSIDVRDLIENIGFQSTELNEMAFCPILDVYRQSAGVENMNIDVAPTHFDDDMNDVNVGTIKEVVISCDEEDLEMNDDKDEINYSPDEHDNDFDMNYDWTEDNDGDHNTINSNQDLETEVNKGCPTPARASMLKISEENETGLATSSPIQQNKIAWDAVFEEATDQPQDDIMPMFDDDFDDNRGNKGEGSNEGEDRLDLAGPILSSAAGVEISQHNDYNFFNTEAMSKVANFWAGSRHWKFSLRNRNNTNTDEEKEKRSATDCTVNNGNIAANEEGHDNVAGSDDNKKSSRSTKEKFNFDFSSEWVSEDCKEFQFKQGKTDPTSLTAAAVEKALINAVEGNLLLPFDAKLEIKDLFRLFLQPNMLAPPQCDAKITASTTTATIIPAQVDEATVGQVRAEIKDQIWGQEASPIEASLEDDIEEEVEEREIWDANNNLQDMDDNAVFDFDEGFLDADVTRQSITAQEINSRRSLAIDMGDMVRAGRMVEKVNIGYAKVAKRVNVRKLKTDLWSHLDNHCAECSDDVDTIKSSHEDSNDDDDDNNDHDHNDSSNKDPEKKNFGFDILNANNKVKDNEEKADTISFKDCIADIAVDQKQKEATVSFYFICLLHLANEKTLRIVDQTDLADLTISKDL